ncbi:MAG TPA: hypothetical protein ENI69_06390, partial [Rhodospirillales bacterium]|nr:hypothetical protein [Rhodospirillales bacterium]
MNEEASRTNWHDLVVELDAWQAEGGIATLWWRDDDAAQVTNALEKMLTISEDSKTPLALAVIPAAAGVDLKRRLAGHAQTHILQHGLAHKNHQPVGGKKSEFGDSRHLHQVQSDLSEGRDVLSAWHNVLPVFVPPWNRMENRFLDLLPKLGFTGVSCFKARRSRLPVPGLLAVNSHVDLIQSRDGNRRFIGTGAALQATIDHLSSRRRGRVDRDEPTGILTHHLDHDDGAWRFVERFLAVIT